MKTYKYKHKNKRSHKVSRPTRSNFLASTHNLEVQNYGTFRAYVYRAKNK